ncbi:SDR family NAD(P)-dependent oxidoreductase [Streptomyces hyaluromycini]|uniref:SDR family NAD(P)-dependent oxidoreductase n=1 Tax=Streptomyces hyaluromycini TaxID=1377993 RepID=UPI001C3FAB44|nr:SDR family NAD(P)-dependent oxidoreductase [Streptomyces hyaluromycini]
MNDKWTARDVPGQSGRVAVVTGSNTGIGFDTARVLAAHGATVVLAVRDAGKGRQAADRISAAAPGADVTVQPLDLTSLESVRTAADALQATYPTIDLLINNAGVMYTPKSTTRDGFEMQLGTNHLGHFALTGLLLERMLPVAGSRVVTVSSIVHRVQADVDLKDLQWERRTYSRGGAYGQSKLANLLFTYELQRRLAGKGSTIAIASHPGIADTELMRNSPLPVRALAAVIRPWLLQSADRGALPTLRAATDPDVQGGEFYGPDGFLEGRGRPVRVKSSKKSHDAVLQHGLWAESERVTGVSYPV